MRSATLAIVAVLASACFPLPFPLGCQSTWFHSCSSRSEEPVPVPLSSARDGFRYTWVVRSVVRGGVLVVTIRDLPGGRWVVQARRPGPAGEVVLGEMEVWVPEGTSLTEIEVWPNAGRSIGANAYPVFRREK